MPIRRKELQTCYASTPRKEGGREVADFGVNFAPSWRRSEEYARTIMFQSRRVQSALQQMEEGLDDAIWKVWNGPSLMDEFGGNTKEYQAFAEQIRLAATFWQQRRYGPSGVLCTCGRANCWLTNPVEAFPVCICAAKLRSEHNLGTGVCIPCNRLEREGGR